MHLGDGSREFVGEVSRVDGREGSGEEADHVGRQGGQVDEASLGEERDVNQYQQGGDARHGEQEEEADEEAEHDEQAEVEEDGATNE